MYTFVSAAVIVIVGVALIGYSCRHLVYIVPDGRVEVVHRFGRLASVRRPGLRIRFPFGERITVVDIRPFGARGVFDARSKDGHVLHVVADIELVIVDPVVYSSETRAFHDVGLGLIDRVIEDCCRRRSAIAVCEHCRDLADAVGEVLSERLRRFGVEPRRVELDVETDELLAA